MSVICSNRGWALPVPPAPGSLHSVYAAHMSAKFTGTIRTASAPESSASWLKCRQKTKKAHTHTQQYPEIILSIYVYYTHTHIYIYTCVCVWSRFSRVQLFVTLWIMAHQAPLSLGFPRQEYQSGLPFPPLGIFPSQGSNLSLFSLLLCRRILYCWATREAYKDRKSVV